MQLGRLWDGEVLFWWKCWYYHIQYSLTWTFIVPEVVQKNEIIDYLSSNWSKKALNIFKIMSKDSLFPWHKVEIIRTGNDSETLWVVWCIPSPSHTYQARSLTKWLKAFEKTLSQWKYTICYNVVIDISGESCLDLVITRVKNRLSYREKIEFKIFESWWKSHISSMNYFLGHTLT